MGNRMCQAGSVWRAAAESRVQSCPGREVVREAADSSLQGGRVHAGPQCKVLREATPAVPGLRHASGWFVLPRRWKAGTPDAVLLAWWPQREAGEDGEGEESSLTR